VTEHHNIIDQILEKLLSEREKKVRVERELLSLNSTMFLIRNRLDADDTDSAVDALERVMRKSEADQRELQEFRELAIPEVRAALQRALVAAGLTTTGRLAADAENLARLLESANRLQTGIL
jgi:predicted translin family RNA/ssDNA-binding protein